MARVRRRRRPNTGVQLVQIAVLLLVLVIILLFRTQIGAGAGNFFSAFRTSDVQLPEQPSTGEATPSTTGSPHQPDAAPD